MAAAAPGGTGGSLSAQGYYVCIKRTLHAALCITNYPSQTVERHNKPEVETGASEELLLNPVTICRDESERVLIETGINSVRVSVEFHKGPGMGAFIAQKYVSFLEQRAERFHILRRKPTKGYDISFLITNDEAETMHKHKVIDFIVQFMSDVQEDLTGMRMLVNARFARASEALLKAMVA